MTGGSGAAGGGDAPRGDLFAEMRRIKDASQLSYNRLADKTHYSRSSWERFLNGKQVPTRVAVEEFAAAAGADPEPLLALLELAVVREEAPADEPAARTAERPRPAAGPSAAPAPAPGAPEPEQPEQATPVRRFAWSRILRAAAGVLAGALLGSLLTVFLTEPAGAGTTARGSTAGATGSPAAASAQARPSGPVKVGCKSDTCMRREPQAEDCQWDAVTVRQTFLRGMSIQLRYSEACQAVWGRVENGNIGDTVRIMDKRSSSDEATIRMEHDTYTRMLAVTPDATWETITICGAIPSQKEQECSPLGEIKP
ncbi:helix-turn-helix domain-containing protein [Streptomyces vinaceus]|uniref:helix-turn-helix domain-containing protein n=2 Tax=Streptomyces vinaceus TaxID=1960 RepID=UPI00369CA811